MRWDLFIISVVYDNNSFLDKIYDVIILNSEEMYVGYAHNYVEKFVFEDTKNSEGVKWQFSQRAGKCIWEDECILFQLAFLPVKQWKNLKYLVASATMFGSISVWNYKIEASEGISKEFLEMRSILWEFKGHEGVIFNLRWINEAKLWSTSGDRVVKVWELTDDKDPQPK